LQLQPYMFSKDFFTNVLGMAPMGLPNWIGVVPHQLLNLLLPTHVLFNALFAAIQVAIGAGMLWRRCARVALVGSFVWGLAVWVGGEGIGGLFMPGMSMLIGAPGAAIIYTALSVVLWPTKHEGGRSVAAASVLGERGVIGLWLVIWAGTALLELQLANNAPGALAANVRHEAHGEPGILAAFDRNVAHLVGTHGTQFALAFSLVQVLIAFQVLVFRRRRVVLAAAAAVSMLYWIIGQNFGGIFSGKRTDLSLGPLMFLLALSLWPRSDEAIDATHHEIPTTIASSGDDREGAVRVG
jgi:hypothetical protein